MTITGDINADRRVDIYDAIIFAGLFGGDIHALVYFWYEPWSRLQAIADFDDNGLNDIVDAIMLANNFGKYLE